MAVRKVKIKNRTGIHARPASMLVDTAQKFDSKINMIYEGQEANAKSIMAVMSLAVSHNTMVTLQAEGPDAEEALDALEELIADKFGEDE